MTRLWEPWVYWAYGAGFDRQTEKHVPEAGLRLLESRFVADELIKLLGARLSKAPELSLLQPSVSIAFALASSHRL
jgi:hypothetical protein